MILNQKKSVKKEPNFLKDEVGKDVIKRQTSLYPSNSAEDLRSFDMEKGKQDATSPRGVLDVCDSRTNKFFGDNSKLKFSISRGVFYWNKLFKLWNKRTIKRLASFPPVNVPKAPSRKSRSARENP